MCSQRQYSGCCEDGKLCCIKKKKNFFLMGKLLIYHRHEREQENKIVVLKCVKAFHMEQGLNHSFGFRQ